MAREMLYPDEKPQVSRRSSLEQYKGFLSTMIRGGWSPIVFDQLDGINCETVKSHPVIISWGNDIGYEYSDGECHYASDHFVYTDKEGVEQVVLPTCMGGDGEMYLKYVNKNSFINFDNASLGVHNTKTLRVGLDYSLASETLPAAE